MQRSLTVVTSQKHAVNVEYGVVTHSPARVVIRAWGMHSDLGGRTSMPFDDADSARTTEESARPAAPALAIGRVMPCHAFTERVLLFARGERVATQAQLERLLRSDVIFSDYAPPALAAAIAQRQRALGIARPPAEGVPTPEAASPPLVSDPLADLPPPEEIRPFAGEIAAARAIRSEAMRRFADLIEESRAGRALELRPARNAVRAVIASLRRNQTALASLVRLKSTDNYTYTHSINSCVLAVMLAQETDAAGVAEHIGLGALLHDIGKVRLPAELLHRPGALDGREWELVRQHPLAGIQIAGSSHDIPEAALSAIGEHHERLDGSGYPCGLAKGRISLAGRVVAITDVYDAMTSARPYHGAIPHQEAMRTILEQSGRGFDPDLVRAFIRSVGLFPVGSAVRLNTGETAVVTRVNPEAIRRPTVLIICDYVGVAMAEPRLLDLAQSNPDTAAREITAVEQSWTLASDIDRYLAIAATAPRYRYAGVDSLT